MKIDPVLKASLDNQIANDPKSLDPCFFCGNRFDDDDEIVYHHCHFSGNFLSLAHNSCNLKGKVTFKATCFIHNLKGT